jgi:hypothetical protein
MKRTGIQCCLSGVVLILGVIFFSVPVAANKRIEKDLDEDGVIDQILIYTDTGIILTAETDQDHDGFSERVQYYKEGRLDRIERDTDTNKKMDTVDYIENDKRVRQEKYYPDGALMQVALFDADEQLSHIKKDTTGDRRFDTHYRFEKGRLVLSTRDTDNNDTVNVWTTYENQLPVKQKEDENEDGIMDRVLIFDSTGQIQTMYKDPFAKGKYRTTGFFEKGVLKTRHTDSNEDSKPDTVTDFDAGLPVKEQKDTNFDGRFDTLTTFESGNPRHQKKDTDYDGRWDWFADFDARGRLAQTREDTNGNGKIDRIRIFKESIPVQVKTDTDSDGFFDTISLLENQKIVKNLIDKNQDGKADIEVIFNSKEEKEKLISDSNLDGKTDVWQYYTDNSLVSLHQDVNHDGTVDLKVDYKKGLKTKLKTDADHDGFFELLQIYDDPEWTMIVCEDLNADGRVDIKSFYTGTVLRKKQIDEDLDGLPDVVEYYTAKGGLDRIEERKQGKETLTWFYDTEEVLIRGEEDTNQDGRTDIWYLYEKGILTEVREDTNQDGRADLWETYDQTQAIVKRQKDLDFDGTPDFTDEIDKTENNG